MKSKLFFALDNEFDLTTKEVLEKKSAIKRWDTGLKKYLYFFPMNELKNISKVLGKPIEIDQNEIDLLNEQYPLTAETKVLKKEKGIGYFKVIFKSPKIYIIETVINKKVTKKRLPVETIKAAWDSIAKFSIDKPIKSKTIAKHWCEELGLSRFNRPTGSFDADKLYGTRETYFKFYYSLKVLQTEGVIDYSKSGFVTRIKKDWECQTKMED